MNKKLIAAYKLKCINSDFQVTEVSLVPQLVSKGKCKYSYVWLQKSGFTTFDATEQVTDFFNLNFDDIRSQGLKDEDAITEQLISIKKILTEKDLTCFNKKYRFKNKYSHIKSILGFGNEPVEERKLHGNSFRIVIRNLEEDLASKFLDYVSSNRYFYFINYYDNQRFGMPGGPYNTHLIGKAIIEGDWKRAYEYMKISNNVSPEIIATTKEGGDFNEVFKLINPKKLSFFVSAYNSFLWNNQASLTVKKYAESKEYLFENVGTLNLPLATSFQCPHICEAEGYEFSVENFVASHKSYVRNLIVATTVYGNNLEIDELHKGKKKLTVSFFLPTGCYATMIIKQLFFNIEK